MCEQPATSLFYRTNNTSDRGSIRLVLPCYHMLFCLPQQMQMETSMQRSMAPQRTGVLHHLQLLTVQHHTMRLARAAPVTAPLVMLHNSKVSGNSAELKDLLPFSRKCLMEEQKPQRQSACDAHSG